MQCFDTFRWFLHKLYAATINGKGREGTYIFFSRRLGGSRGHGIGQRGQLPPCHPAGAAHAVQLLQKSNVGPPCRVDLAPGKRNFYPSHATVGGFTLRAATWRFSRPPHRVVQKKKINQWLVTVAYSPNSTWLVTSRHDTTRHVRRVEPMHSARVELVEQHRSTHSTWRARLARYVERVESCRDVTWLAKWNLGLYVVHSCWCEVSTPLLFHCNTLPA